MTKSCQLIDELLSRFPFRPNKGKTLEGQLMNWYPSLFWNIFSSIWIHRSPYMSVWTKKTILESPIEKMAFLRPPYKKNAFCILQLLFRDPHTTYFPVLTPLYKYGQNLTTLYKKWQKFDTYTKNAEIWSKMAKIWPLSIQKMAKVWPLPIQKIAKVWPLYTKKCKNLPPYNFYPLYKKWHFQDLQYKNGIFETTPIQKMAFSNFITCSFWSIIRLSRYIFGVMMNIFVINCQIYANFFLSFLVMFTRGIITAVASQPDTKKYYFIYLANNGIVSG